MTAQILDGKALASQIQQELADEVAEFIHHNGAVPALAVVLVGEDSASEVYIRNKRRACERVGIESRMHKLPADAEEEDLLNLIAKLNNDSQIHGILIQLPLPDRIDESRILLAVNPYKDVDAFHPENVGRLVQGRPRFLPCTPAGIAQLLLRNHIEIAGQHVVVVGRSDIVGKPMAMMLIQRGVDATVTMCHSRTANLAEITRQADILIVAIGRAKLITAEYVKGGAAVVDVGMNRTAEGLVGDVDYHAVREVAGHLTPVPGGVGPLTVTMLLQNTLTAARALES